MEDLNQAAIKRLTKKKVRPSYPRIKILQYLLTKRNHPTVDEIYTGLKDEIPTLSKTTVYNTLNTFISAGLVRLIGIEDNETRYDADVYNHGHFKCQRCQKIYDFVVDITQMYTDGLEGFEVLEKDVYFKGVCNECLKDKILD